VDVYDDPDSPVELGASIFVKVNRILVDAVKEFGLSTSAFESIDDDVPGASLSIWNGKDFVLTQQEEGSWWENAKILWKYGLAPIRTMRLMRSTVGKFLAMYDEPVYPWTSLTQVAQEVGLLAVTAATGEQYMEENGIKGAFGRDIVQASTRVNYAQNLKYIHGLEAMVCMAAEGAMAVEGGNWQIFDSMVTAANATTLLGTEVTTMKKRGDSYVLGYRKANEESPLNLQAQHFDAVMLAAPYQFANLSVSSGPERMPDKVPYVQLHVTLLASPQLISPAFFNLPSDKPAPKVVLTTLPPDEEPKQGADGCGSPGFFSISLLRQVVNPRTSKQEYLYKVFSPSAPNSTFLAHMLGLEQPHDDAETGISEKDISWIYRKVWNSYPYEYPRVTFENIQLDDGLWYTGGMDSFISTMETNALMGKNVARLVINRWREKMAPSFAQAAMEQPGLLA